MKPLLFALTIFITSGCQLGYIVKSGYNQLDLLWSGDPVEELLDDPSLPKETRRKLQLAVDAKKFAEERMGLKKTSNYADYIDLGRPYVTWIVTAAQKHQLRRHTWWFPIIGHVPYKGYFAKENALDEEKTLQERNLDTWVRGVRAYSTLGWFSDPLLSSMLAYDDVDLVDVIIHELVHSTVYIKSQSSFNERLAVFFASMATKRFFTERGRPEVVKLIDDEINDQIRFSKFLGEEIQALRTWYESRESPPTESERTQRFQEIQTRFAKVSFTTASYRWFLKAKLNNARLLAMGTYLKDLSLFEKLFIKMGSDPIRFIEEVRKLEDSDNPEQDLGGLVDS